MDAEEFARKIIEIIDGMGDNDLETISVIEKYCQKLILEKRLAEPEFTKTKKAEETSKVTSKVASKVSDDLEEAARRYATEGDEISGLQIIEVEKDAFIAGAEWQKQQILDCNTTLQRAFELGKQEMKQQLMAKAVDAIVQPYDAEIWLNSQNDLKEFAEGEEVKVIILKKQ